VRGARVGADAAADGVASDHAGAVVLDALDSEAAGKAERDAIANTIRQPVRYLVSSTFHNNYSKGNLAYADVWKIGTESYRTDLLALMRRERVSADEQKARLPNETFRDRLTLYLGGKEIQVLFLGRGHTRGDSLIYVPQDRIAYLSELFFAGQFLYIDDGYGLDWLKTLDAVEALGADIFVPAHGPIPADPRETHQELGRFRQMLVDIRDSVQAEVARGASEDQAVAAIRWPQYEKMQGYNAEREVAVRRLYQQLTGALK
jgi:glyoxylase-like metal-dependent hydrolase (beta-lactamase superfamily II)